MNTSTEKLKNLTPIKDFKDNIISLYASCRDALLQLNELSNSANLTLFVLNDSHQLIGTLTDGDIRRGLLEGKSMDGPLREFIHTKFRYIVAGEYTIKDISNFKKADINLIPLLDKDKRILKIINLRQKRSVLPAEAVIMAGGRGSRLRPLTDLVPKPLLKIGDKPIIEYNIDRLCNYGIDKIHLSVRYLGNQLIEYFGNGEEKGVQINYVTEDTPLGTLGAITMVENFQEDTILVMNSDLLTNIDYEDMFSAFQKKNADMMVACIPYKVDIPYAVIETNGDQIASFKEKPTYTYYSNAGIYLFKKEHLNLVPEGELYNATDLIDDLIKNNQKVCYYPILGYWLDIGKPADFQKAQEDIKHIKF